jgi:tRNA G18 (ribose-2'-O)-methylase SpoU
VPVVAIASPDDPRLDDYRAVREPELVRRRGLFIAESRLVVARLVALPRYVIRSLLATPSGLAGLRELTGDAPVPGDPPILVAPDATIAALGGIQFHRGCLAIVERPAPPDPTAILAAARPGRPLIAVEGVAHADNVGSILRNAHAFGAAGVLFDGASVDPLYRKALRTSMGAALAVPWTRLEPWPAGLARLREAGCLLAALTPQAPGDTLPAFGAAHADRAIALLVGAEGEGLSAAALAAADARVRIPMAAGADSVNVATATGIALYALTHPRS